MQSPVQTAIVLATLPAVTMALAIHYSRGHLVGGARPKRLLTIAGLFVGGVQIILLYAALLWESRHGGHDPYIFTHLFDLAAALCLFTLVASVLGVGRGRILLAVSAISSLLLWLMVIEPAFI